MGKGRFVNQKLGKNVSRKFDLLKSELAGRSNRKSSSRPLNLPVPKKEISRGKPWRAVPPNA
jgi:hypothetical protein